MMRGLTLRIPWSFAVTHLGKPVENRTWRPRVLKLGEDFAIHAGRPPRLAVDGKHYTAAGATHIDEIIEAIRWMDGLGLLKGHGPVAMRTLLDAGVSSVVAVVRFGGIVFTGEPAINLTSEGPARWSGSKWFVGPIGWLLEDVRVLKEPVPCRGQAGLRELSPDVEVLVRAQLKQKGES